MRGLAPVLVFTALFLPRAAHGACDEIRGDDARVACYDKLAECRTVTDAAARLQCYDNQPAPHQDVMVAAPEPRPIAKPPVPPVDVDNFGKREPIKQDDEVEGITASILEVESRSGIDYIRLDNGQVWRETTDQTTLLKVGQEVTIRKAVFGSYSLTSKPSPRLVKVKRVK